MKKNLGALPNKKDLRDIKLGSVQAPVIIPDTFKPELIDQYPKYFQGQQPACGAHSGTTLKVIQQTEEEKKIVSLSPRFLWAMIKASDNIPIENGTTMRDIFKTLQSAGVCDFNLLGNNVELSTNEYAHPKLTDEMKDNAQIKIISAYAFLPTGFTIDDLKQAIYKNKAVILLMRVDNGFFNTTIPTLKQALYGHFVVAVGYDQGGIWIIDSTEQDFSKSVKYIKSEYMKFIYEGGTAIDLPDEQVRALVDKKRLLQKLLELYTQLKSLLKI